MHQVSDRMTARACCLVAQLQTAKAMRERCEVMTRSDSLQRPSSVTPGMHRFRRTVAWASMRQMREIEAHSESR